MRVALLGHTGKVGVVLAPALEAAGHEVKRIGRGDAVEAEALAELAGVLLAPEKLSAAGIGPDEGRFLAAVEHVNPGLAKAA